MNLVVRTTGAQKTHDEIKPPVPLKDDAQKIFRGTIDFKKAPQGSASEQRAGDRF